MSYSICNVLKEAGVSNIEISDSNIKSFERVAKKYGMFRVAPSTTALSIVIFHEPFTVNPTK